jgi:four helix bundle protein
VTYDQWEAQVPKQIRDDPLWHVEAYKLALFLSDLAWPDALKLLKHKLMRGNADQLYRAASNISSNITEGYSRSSPTDRARFFEYALGSARETRDWYYNGRRALPEPVTKHRLNISTQLIALFVTMITTERCRKARISRRSIPEEK